MNREERWAKYGKPVRLPDDVPGRVMVWEYTSEEAASAAAEANSTVWGHPAWVEQRGDKWVSIVDVGLFIDKLARGFNED